MAEYTPTTEEVLEAVSEWAWGRRMFRADLTASDGKEFDRWLAAHDAEVRAGVVAEEPEPSERIHQLIHDLTDPGECWFDHHGGCQEHGYLTLRPGEKCPHAEARELLASWVPVKQEGK